MFEIVRRDSRSRARAGRLMTGHGAVETPSYVIVGTHAAVRCLEQQDIPATKTQLIIANTYHLWRTLGDEGLRVFEGVHRALGWDGPVMTDSGGFQVFSLGFLRAAGVRRGNGKEEPGSYDAGRSLVRIMESGVYFDDGEEAYLDAELSMRIQEQIGADIVVAFDEPTAPRAERVYTKAAMERTHAWARRSLEAKESSQKIYGVVQGGNFEDLRRESGAYIGKLPFDGFAIGSTYGEAYGGTREGTVRMIRWSCEELPEEKPRHLFGVGRIEDLFLGVEEGIDTFDCVIPTREARHAAIWTSEGRIDMRKNVHTGSDAPLDALCACPACAVRGVTRGELHEFFRGGNPEAGHLATIHNVYFFNDLMEQIRESIRGGRFLEFKKEYLGGLNVKD